MTSALSLDDDSTSFCNFADDDDDDDDVIVFLM